MNDRRPFQHQTVLLAETCALLNAGENRLIVDGTLGGGGHAEALLEAGARVIGIDRDPLARAAAKERLARFGDRLQIVAGAFGDVLHLVTAKVDGFLLDLGVSSPQFDTPERGFSFSFDGPLDMRMSDQGATASDLIEDLEADALADLIYRYGEERFSRPIARSLKAAHPKTTFEAVAAVKSAVPRRAWPKDIHVATRTFQALRIAVNDELGQLDRALAAIPSLLRQGGRAAIISFHSLEDRAVKHAFREFCAEGSKTLPRGLPIVEVKKPAFVTLTRKAMIAQDEEIAKNPRARSAKLRAVEKVS